jgi:hypothetical protein
MRHPLRNVRPWSLVLLGAALAVGCSESVTQRDVDAAKKKADEQHHEAVVARAQSPDDPSKIMRKDEQANDADRKLRETEAKAAATSARDAFVSQVDGRVAAADRRIDELQKAASNQEGALKDDTNKKIDDLKARRDRVKDALSTLKSAELLQWQQHRAEVQRRVDEMNSVMI